MTHIIKTPPHSATLLLLFLIITCIVTSDDVPADTLNVLDHQLDAFKSIDYKEMYHKPINVSLGQELSIVLPSFDSVYSPTTFSFKFLSQQEYTQTLSTLQTLNSDNDDDFQSEQQPDTQPETQSDLGTAVSEADLPLKCNYVPPQANVFEVISKINDESGFNRASFQNKQYIHVTSRQLLYILNSQSMLLSAYYYNDINIKFLSSFQLPANKNQGSQSQTSQGYSQSHASVSMSLNSKETELYIFSPSGVWTVQTKTFLTNIKQTTTISGFDTVQIGGLDKTIRGGGSYFVGMKKMNKVFIIPQVTTNQRALYTQVSMFNEERVFPQDIAVHSSYLFVLDVFKGVYVYRISADNRARELFKIALSNYGGYQKLHLFQMNTLFVNFNDFDGSKVVEINVDLENQKAELVRYFKNDDYISYIQTFSVLTSSTGFYLSEIKSADEVDMKHIRNSAETLLFMVSNFQQIHIFPFNIDPRTINAMYNGVKIYYPKVKQVYHVFGDRYLVITEETIDYVKISIEKPQVSCRLGSRYNEEYKINADNLKITVQSNVSTCEFRNKLLRHKTFYNQNCQLTIEYLVHINDPEKSSLRKIVTYGIVLLVVAAFSMGLYCLVQWRNEKLIVLSRLKDEIIKFRNKHRRMQPFVEEQSAPKKQVEIEVPQDIQFIPNDQQDH